MDMGGSCTPTTLRLYGAGQFGNVLAETNGTVREYIWLPETEIAPTFWT
jgi:hypothetical protein